MQKLKDYLNENLYDYSNSLLMFKNDAVGEAKNMYKNFKGTFFISIMQSIQMQQKPSKVRTDSIWLYIYIFKAKQVTYVRASKKTLSKAYIQLTIK
jgi:hypothetical protein